MVEGFRSDNQPPPEAAYTWDLGSDYNPFGDEIGDEGDDLAGNGYSPDGGTDYGPGEDSELTDGMELVAGGHSEPIGDTGDTVETMGPVTDRVHVSANGPSRSPWADTFGPGQAVRERPEAGLPKVAPPEDSALALRSPDRHDTGERPPAVTDLVLRPDTPSVPERPEPPAELPPAKTARTELSERHTSFLGDKLAGRDVTTLGHDREFVDEINAKAVQATIERLVEDKTVHPHPSVVVVLRQEKGAGPLVRVPDGQDGYKMAAVDIHAANIGDVVDSDQMAWSLAKAAAGDDLTAFRAYNHLLSSAGRAFGAEGYDPLTGDPRTGALPVPRLRDIIREYRNAPRGSGKPGETPAMPSMSGREGRSAREHARRAVWATSREANKAYVHALGHFLDTVAPLDRIPYPTEPMELDPDPEKKVTVLNLLTPRTPSPDQVRAIGQIHTNLAIAMAVLGHNPQGYLDHVAATAADRISKHDATALLDESLDRRAGFPFLASVERLGGSDDSAATQLIAARHRAFTWPNNEQAPVLSAALGTVRRRDPTSISDAVHGSVNTGDSAGQNLSWEGGPDRDVKTGGGHADRQTGATLSFDRGTGETIGPGPRFQEYDLAQGLRQNEVAVVSPSGEVEGVYGRDLRYSRSDFRLPPPAASRSYAPEVERIQALVEGRLGAIEPARALPGGESASGDPQLEATFAKRPAIPGRPRALDLVELKDPAVERDKLMATFYARTGRAVRGEAWVNHRNRVVHFPRYVVEHEWKPAFDEAYAAWQADVAGGETTLTWGEWSRGEMEFPAWAHMRGVWDNHAIKAYKEWYEEEQKRQAEERNRGG